MREQMAFLDNFVAVWIVCAGGGVLELEEESDRSSLMNLTASRRLMRTPATSTLSCGARVCARCSRNPTSVPPVQVS